MKIYTSYYSKIKELVRDNIIPVSISRTLPKYYCGLLHYKNLAPSRIILDNYKNNKDYTEQLYIEDFKENILSKLNQHEEYMKILQLVYSSGLIKNINGIALICYERSNEFCHRHIVANWFNEKGYEIYEYK